MYMYIDSHMGCDVILAIIMVQKNEKSALYNMDLSYLQPFNFVHKTQKVLAGELYLG